MFIMKRELLSDFDDELFLKYNSTWFMNVVHNFLCISKGNKFMLASNCFLNIRTMNYAHYNIYEVFFRNFKYVLYNCSSDLKIKKKYVKICYKKLLKEHMPYFEYAIKIGIIDTFKTKPKWRYIKHTLSYFNSWFRFLPIVFCPKFILLRHYRRKNK